MTRQPLKDPSDRPRRRSGIQPIDPPDATDPDEVTQIATPRARRATAGSRFSATAPNAEPVDRRALPFVKPNDRRGQRSDPPGPISQPPASPWHHEAGVDREALPSALMPEALRSDPPPQPPPSLMPTTAGRQTAAVVVLAAVLVAGLAALAVWQTL